ncbi:MAG: NAD(P)H-hydrate dehydratase [Myxococcales bacterium]|nr:NAD(P)H-hydrate dehydratase [Myxococcales bacterium]
MSVRRGVHLEPIARRTATPVVTADEMREADRLTIEEAGIPALVLVENAGRAVADATFELLQVEGDSPGLVAIVCGRGNNGSDGFAAARHLWLRGVRVTCVLLGTKEGLRPEVRAQLDMAQVLGVTVLEVAAPHPSPSDAIEASVETAIETATVLVDALFGVGLDRPVSGLAAELIALLNRQGAPIVAVDIPSGLDATTGQGLGEPVHATVTVTMAAPKRGLVVHPGANYAGRLIVADIGIPDAVIDHLGPRVALIDDLGGALRARRPADCHKGQMGHVLVIGGAPGKGGAVLLAGAAALRFGAGLVTIATHADCQGRLEGLQPELMVEAGYDDVGLRDDVMARLIVAADSVVIGPGMPTGPVGVALVALALSRSDLPVVLDAGALTVLAAHPAMLATRARPLVLTPHPGEAARLLGRTTADIADDRFGALDALIHASMAIVVLKGAATLVGEPEGRIAVCTRGNPGMATAGTGDVLAGMIACSLHHEPDPFDAVRIATWAHATAGDLAAADVGEESLIASDLIARLGRVLRGETGPG